MTVENKSIDRLFIMVIVCALLLAVNVICDIAFNKNQVKYGVFMGSYESNIRHNQQLYTALQDEVRTLNAWKTNMKAEVKVLSSMVEECQRNYSMKRILGGS